MINCNTSYPKRVVFTRNTSSIKHSMHTLGSMIDSTINDRYYRYTSYFLLLSNVQHVALDTFGLRGKIFHKTVKKITRVNW